MGSLLTVNREIDRLALACKNSYGIVEANGNCVRLTCIARRLPVGSVSTPDIKHPIGTHNKFIEPEIWT